MERHCVTGLLLYRITLSILLLLLGMPALSQVTDGIDLNEMIYESKEENEELTQKLKSKITISEFMNDKNLHANFISELQYKNLLEHIEANGELIDLLELQSITSFSITDYNTLKSILYIDPLEKREDKNNIRINTRTTYQSAIESNYVGGNWGNYQQLKISLSENIKIGIAREVDIGEKNNHLLGDHQSYYLNKKWRNIELTIGGYQVYHGFGLLIGQGYAVNYGSGGINNLIQYKWVGNASQTEINTLNGAFLKQNFKKLAYSIGYSSQKIDDGTPTGYHRTLNEISKKKQLKEQLLVTALEQNFAHAKYSVLGIYNKETSEIGYSLGIQHYYRNIISFFEGSRYNRKYAYSFGWMILITKDVLLNISHTHYDNNYSSPWQSYTTQGFSENDGNGYAINIGIPFKRKWSISYTYKFSSKVMLEENTYGKESKYTQSLRIDKMINKLIKFTTTTLIQRNNFDAPNIRNKSSFQYSSNEHFQQEYSVLLHTNNQYYSKGLSYNLKYKDKLWKVNYSIGFFNINSSLPIYYSIENTAQTRQTIAVYNTGVIHSFGFSYKLKRKIQSSFFMSYSSDVEVKIDKYKITLSFQYI